MKCSTCKFYSASGECRRNPPVNREFVREWNDGGVSGYTYASWPRVSPEHWCGEYVKAKVKP